MRVYAFKLLKEEDFSSINHHLPVRPPAAARAGDTQTGPTTKNPTPQTHINVFWLNIYCFFWIKVIFN